MNRFVIAEPSKCIGCRTCEVACVLAHPVGENTTQTLSPDNFKPRLKLVSNARVTAPIQCRQCENAPCAAVCPTQALVRQSGIIHFLADRCIGCQTCAVACPFGAMEMVKVPVRPVGAHAAASAATVTRAQKCDVCIDRAEGPACIAVCPTAALSLIDDSSLEAMSEQRRMQALSGMPEIVF